MKLRKDDNVIVITGRDKGKTGKVLSINPKEGRVIVEGINVVKRHTKPNAKYPRGGIIDVTKPVPAGKVMIIDPVTGHPARIGYAIDKNGNKERIFKVAAAVAKRPKPKAAAKPDAPKKTASKTSTKDKS